MNSDQLPTEVAETCGFAAAFAGLLQAVTVVPLSWPAMYVFPSHPKGVPPAQWTCAFCGADTGNDRGWKTEVGNGPPAVIRLCPICGAPTFFDEHGHAVPQPLPGNEVDHLPVEVGKLYREARASIQAEAFTASVMASRTILAHVAVHLNAAPNLKFVQYVDYLEQNHHIPPNGRGWVDYIRKRGNEATHDIVLMTKADAEGVLIFVEALLRNVYELPGSVPT